MYKYLIVLTLAISLMGCSNAKETNEANVSPSSTNQTIDVDEGLFDVTITLPNSFFESLGTTAEEAVNNQKESGANFKNVKLNDDQSVEVTMSKSDYKKMMDDLATNIKNSVQEIVDNKEEFTSITSIDYNKDFSEFTVTTSASELGFEEVMLAIPLYFYGGIYQIFTPDAKVSVTVTYKDQDGNILDTATYDEATMNELNGNSSN